LEKLPIRITRENPSTRRAVGRLRLEIAKMSSSTMMRSCAAAAVRIRCAFWGESVAPVGLWRAALVT